MPEVIMRLDKFLSNFAGVSRSEAKKLLKSGEIAVDGRIIRSADYALEPSSQAVAIGGRIIPYHSGVCLLLNKPRGYVCSTDDREGIPVNALVPDYPTVFPAGRLDKDTEGMLILTDIGELAHKLITPAKHVPKYYIARLETRFDERCVALFEDGVTIGGEKCLPAKICALGNGSHALVELHEGKYHQVRRMLEGVGNRVVFLRRIQIGQLVMPPELPLGAYLEVMHNDVEKLLKADFFNIVSARVSAEFSSL